MSGDNAQIENFRVALAVAAHKAEQDLARLRVNAGKRLDKAQAALVAAETAGFIKGRDAAAAEAESETEQAYISYVKNRGSWTSGLRPKWAEGSKLAAAIRAIQPPSPSPVEAAEEPGSEVLA